MQRPRGWNKPAEFSEQGQSSRALQATVGVLDILCALDSFWKLFEQRNAVIWSYVKEHPAHGESQKW